MKIAARSFVLLLVLAASALAQEAEPPTEPLNETCPVMEGEEVLRDLWVDYRGKRVWFCCESCVDDFKADPEAYLQNLPQFEEILAEEAAAAADAAGAEEDTGEHEAGEPEATEAGSGGEEDGHEHEGGEEEEDEHVLGVLHPMFVHFPIALTVAAAIAALLTIVLPIRFLKDARTFLIVLAALMIVPTFLLGGEAEEAQGKMSEARHEMVEQHELWGTIALWTILGVALVEILHRIASGTGWLKWVALVAILGGAAVVGLTGFYGAEVTHGADHLKPVLERFGLG